MPITDVWTVLHAYTKLTVLFNFSEAGLVVAVGKPFVKRAWAHTLDQGLCQARVLSPHMLACLLLTFVSTHACLLCQACVNTYA